MYLNGNAIDNVPLAKRLFGIISKREIQDLNTAAHAVRCLELLTNQAFRNTKEFYRKMRIWLSDPKSRRPDLRAARRARGWTLEDLAFHLNVTIGKASAMENGISPLSDKAREVIRRTRIRQNALPFPGE